MPDAEWQSIIAIVTLTSVTILLCKYCDKTEIERYFFKQNKVKYYVFVTCYTIVMIALMFHIRYIVSYVFKK